MVTSLSFKEETIVVFYADSPAYLQSFVCILYPPRKLIKLTHYQNPIKIVTLRQQKYFSVEWSIGEKCLSFGKFSELPTISLRFLVYENFFIPVLDHTKTYKYPNLTFQSDEIVNFCSKIMKNS